MKFKYVYESDGKRYDWQIENRAGFTCRQITPGRISEFAYQPMKFLRHLLK